MISKNILLQKLPPFMNNQRVIMKNQNVGDIIKGILSTHEQYKSQYDKISPFFLGENLEETCYNIWEFLKENVPYRIESDNLQTLRSPASIISGIPADCKTYSLFSMGITDSLRRKSLINCNLAFRFAGYNHFSDNLEHVFTVINPKSNNEIWCDAVLPNFNEKKQPSIYKDKNIKMALVALSGIGADLSDSSTNTGSEDGTSSDGSQVDAKTIAEMIKVISSLFSSKPNANDWQGWDEQDRANGQWDGSSVRGYVLNDGDSVQNEALNIVSYIKSKGIQKLVNSGHKVTVPGKGWRDVTIDEIANKLSRGGYGQEAVDIKNAYLGVSTAGRNTVIPPTTQMAGMNIWVILALGAAALYAITKKKK
jgi:hypothetical protein